MDQQLSGRSKHCFIEPDGDCDGPIGTGIPGRYTNDLDCRDSFRIVVALQSELHLADRRRSAGGIVDRDNSLGLD